MSFSILFKDELKGFYLSKVMMILWIGLPILTILLYVFQPDSGMEIPFAVFTAMVVSSIAGVLASIMLAVGIISEKNQNVYELFVIRPVKRRDMILAKFLAVYVCVTIANILAIAIGLIIDYAINGGNSELLISSIGQSLVMSMSMMAIASSAGVLIGVASPSILAGVVLVIFGSNQISAISTVPIMLNLSDPIPFTLGLSGILTGILLLISILVFNRKQF